MSDPYPPNPPRPGGESPTWHGADEPEGPWGQGPAAYGSTPGTGGPPRRRRRRRLPLIAAALAVVLLLGTLALAATFMTVRSQQQASPLTSSGATDAQRWPVGAPPVQQANAAAPDWTATAKAAAPSVVSIQVASGSAQGQGSGVILDAKGNVVTNAHVVAAGGEGRPQILVTLDDKRAYQARIVGTDVSTDLAVIALQSPPNDLRPITMGDGDQLQVGSPVMAVGNPLGLAGTVTTGIVSALNRPVRTQAEGATSPAEAVVTNAIQTSAAINPGNSGGALVNASGQLVGINSSIAQTSQDGGNIGIGFAIPVAEVRSVSDQLLRTGSVQHPLLGVTGSERSQYVREGGAQRAAAVVGTVASGSPADRAGVRPGDGVVAVDGDVVDSWLALVAQVREKNVGQAITLTVVRDGERRDLRTTLVAQGATTG
ncbi:S1C family serine protease [Agilicoccus flavus]|uniref:S1C family serine protease n=1 Tax=Agilicoccus flavus TaxID=2775968 RepID=UPI001CF6F6D8|nr:trypsin-like peptidase domain-containing protein [Agilicoccus flavus]